MLDYARSIGLDTDAILRDLDLPPSALRDFDLRVPASLYARAWEDASRAARDSAFGLHAGLAARLDDFDVLGYALHFSATLGDALDHIVRFHRVLCDAWAIAMEDTPTRVRIRRIERTPASEAEAAFAVLVRAARDLTGQPLVPRAVRFTHAPMASENIIEEIFGCPVRFGAPHTELELDRGALSLPVHTADHRLLAVLERYMAKDLGGLLPRGSSVVDQVRAASAKALREGRRPSLGATARELRASPRTVQRRLREAGTAFTDVVDDVRREFAERLLLDGTLSITEITFLTGFTDVSGFRRRYKSWTGHPPSQRLRRA
jgi:AraC-like DNA-binding protein